MDPDQGKGSQTAVDLDQLVTAATAIMAQNSSQGKKVQVFIRGDKAVDYGAVVGAMGGLQKAGVGNVGLITEAPGS